jgi:hypothetical protein
MRALRGVWALHARPFGDEAARLSESRRRALACAMLVAVLAFTFFFARLEFARREIQVNNCILGADVARYSRALEERAYAGFNLRKHPLAVVAVAAAAWPLTTLGVPPGPAGSAALAGWQALGAFAAFLFLRRHFLGNLNASLLTILALSSFSAITVFSIPETYGVTFTAASLALVAFGELARLASRRPLAAGLLAGLAGAPAGWANLPAAAIVLGYAGLAWRRLPPGAGSRLAAAAILPCGICVGATALPTFILDASSSFGWQQRYIAAYASWANFIDARIVLDYLASFLVFSFVARLEHLRCRFAVADFAQMSGSVLRSAAWAAAAGTIALGVARGLAKPASRAFVLGMLAVVAALFVFYLYFNPDEALLYGSRWATVLYLAAAAGLRDGRAAAALGLASALALSVNIAPLHDPRSADPAVCCPIPPASEKHLYPAPDAATGEGRGG